MSNWILGVGEFESLLFRASRFLSEPGKDAIDKDGGQPDRLILCSGDDEQGEDPGVLDAVS